MRRSTLWSIVWTVSIALCGWGWVEGRVRPPSRAGAQPSSLPALRAADAGRTVHLRPGQWLAIDLPGASASGYRCWVEDPAAPVLRIEQEPVRALKSHGWTFRAAGRGGGLLRFGCRHELSAEPERRFEYPIRVE